MVAGAAAELLYCSGTGGRWGKQGAECETVGRDRDLGWGWLSRLVGMVSVSSGIQVFDFDSVHQANMWRTLGAEEAEKRLDAAVRMALLMGTELVLDRNQVLDGVYFLSRGPEGLAAVLGLGPGEPLPVRIKCAPGSVGLAGGEDGERWVPVQRGWGGGARVSLDVQLAQVRQEEFVAMSSARMALLGDVSDHAWLWAPCDSQVWVRGAGFRFFSGPVEDTSVVEALEAAQDEWVAAMACGRVAVDDWSQTRTGPLEMGRHLASLRSEILGRGVQLTGLGEFVTGLELNRRTEVVDEVHRWVLANMGPEDNPLSHARCAMELWSRGFYRALSAAEGMGHLAFFEPEMDEGFADQYGLSLPVRSRRQRVKDRLVPRSARLKEGQTMRVDGTLIDDMIDISGSEYARLRAVCASATGQLAGPSPEEALQDIAFYAMEATGAPVPRRVSRRQAWWRIISGMALAVIVTGISLFADLAELSRSQSVVVVVAAAMLGAVVGLPWQDMREVVRLRKHRMTATMTLVAGEV